ncbi:glycosyltransferase family 4 protein [Dongia soli]|uniref:MraY family glycosyltransferase n=1 Tax=Dongia soli TaxID=600628 RepID=A0ABU5EH07_9PROT|nr:MraY family glycosyltransferase [Dongia soli]MDY0885646.1 MraY family glycosyltransferase [Dongia soli]
MMELALCFIMSFFISVVLIPILMRYAPQLGLVDRPEARKIHLGLVPRVGGIGIVLSAMVPIFVFAPIDITVAGYLIGATIIVVFGVLDDRLNLDFRLKFLGQAAGASAAIAAGIGFDQLPLLDMEGYGRIALYAVAMVFLIGVTNAFNLIDGLDGLAAGSALISLAALGMLSVLTHGTGPVVMIAVAIIGGILGFLKYNTHPAIVFMGDGGSQFLGFSIGALAMLLIDGSQERVSPATILPLLGLSLFDTAMVMFIRLREGRSPFSPDRNHIHYKLLDLGLKHHQAVAAIYGLQSLMVVAAYQLRFQDDLTIILVYVCLCAACVVTYRYLRQHKQRQQHAGSKWFYCPQSLRNLLLLYIKISVAAYLVLGACIVAPPSVDMGILALGLALFTILSVAFSKPWSMMARRLSAYLASIYVSYLFATSIGLPWLNVFWFHLWIASIGVAVTFVLVFSPRDEFRLSNLDILIVIVALGALTVSAFQFNATQIASLVIQGLVLIYACECLLAIKASRFGAVGFLSTLSLLLTGAQLLLSVR